MKKIITLFALSILTCFSSRAQLAAGDIAFIGINTDATEGFAFIALTEIPGGTKIFFTDRGVKTATTWNTSIEMTLSITLGADGLSCGDIVGFEETGADVISLTGAPVGTTLTLITTPFNLGPGDQMSAYTYSGGSPSAPTPADATFLAAVHLDYAADCFDAVTTWNESACVSSTGESIVPPGLTNATNCLSMTPSGPEIDNAKYTGTLTGTSAFLLGEINDFTNWTTNDGPRFSLTPADFSPSVTCPAPCVEPDEASVSAAPTSICAGETSTLTISGDLNDATAWHIYTGSCGGTEIGTTAGTTFDVSPAVTTTYFVRGEGGCTTPGSCGTVTVTITPEDDPTFSYALGTYCPSAADPTPSITTPGGTFTSSPAGLVINASTGEVDISASDEGIYTIEYLTGGDCPNSSSTSFEIGDDEAPIPTAADLPTITAQCEVASLSDPGVTDNCAASVIITNDAVLPISGEGTTTITWTYDDGNGNTTTQTQTIIIDDTTPPTPDDADLEDVTAECEVTELTAPTGSDNCGGAVTVTNDAVLPITGEGTTLVTWTYDDGNGNTSTQTQSIVIDDVTAPTPDDEELEDITAECEVTELTTPAGTDNCGGTVTVTSDAVLPITAGGTTVVTWTYDDGNGNTTTLTQNVIINDETAPVPDAEELEDITAECEVTELVTPTATDNCGGEVTVTNDAELPITGEGTTVVTWTFDDGNGNTTTLTQNVIIDDETAPVPDAEELEDVTAECEVTELDAPTATDNCGGEVTVTNDADLPITGGGTTVVTWTFDDGNGNTTTLTQNVIISDETAPEPDAEELEDVTAECEVTELEMPTATDNCGGVVAVTNDATLPITGEGTTVVTWTYDDGNGNTSTQTQNIIIDDVTAPTPDMDSLMDVTTACALTALDAPSATDNCGGDVIVTSDAEFPITEPTIITWTYDDGNGNTTTQVQSIVFETIDISLEVVGFTINTLNTDADGYQWVDCNADFEAIAGETGTSFSPTENGSYAVIITEGECSDTSECVEIGGIGIDEIATASFVVYPNPTSNGFVQVKTDQTIETIYLHDINGRMLEANYDAGNQRIDLSDVEAGNYILTAITSNGQIMKNALIILK